MLESYEKLNNQAIEHASKGEFTEAIACFKRAISIQNQNPMLWMNLGLTYRDAGDMRAAYSALETSFSMDPYNEEVIESLADVCFHTKRMDEAMSYCMFGLNINPCNSHIWNNMGVLYFNRENYEAAEEAFEQALTLNPYYYDALYNLRDTYSELNNTAGASECNKKMKALRGSRDRGNER
ncbi:MAG: tetratricopeptide repeat protein [Treponema sp.]|nr:tetratricopeptide repeat protein [Treponema sp.]